MVSLIKHNTIIVEKEIGSRSAQQHRVAADVALLLITNVSLLNVLWVGLGVGLCQSLGMVPVVLTTATFQ